MMSGFAPGAPHLYKNDMLIRRRNVPSSYSRNKLPENVKPSKRRSIKREKRSSREEERRKERKKSRRRL